MIAFERPDEPENLADPTIQEHLGYHRDNVAEFGKEESSNFKKQVWLNDNLRELLWKSQSKKCCYCEKLLELKRESDVEHFRPKTKVTEVPDHPGYWWLAYKWQNYLYSCKHCNSDYKINLFPLLNPESRVSDETGNLSDERPYLINPFEEDPSQYLGYDKRGTVVYVFGRDGGEDNRGAETIDICGLNRQELLSRRTVVWDTTMDSLALYDASVHSGNQMTLLKAIRSLKRLSKSSSPHAGMVRFLAEQRDIPMEVYNDNET